MVHALGSSVEKEGQRLLLVGHPMAVAMYKCTWCHHQLKQCSVHIPGSWLVVHSYMYIPTLLVVHTCTYMHTYILMYIHMWLGKFILKFLFLN